MKTYLSGLSLRKNNSYSAKPHPSVIDLQIAEILTKSISPPPQTGSPQAQPKSPVFETARFHAAGKLASCVDHFGCSSGKLTPYYFWVNLPKFQWMRQVARTGISALESIDKATQNNPDLILVKLVTWIVQMLNYLSGMGTIVSSNFSPNA